MNSRIELSSPDITDADIEAVTAVLRTTRLSLGPELAAFEADLARYHSVPDAVAVSSGTAGLHLALLTLGGVVGRLTGRSVWRSALRQLVLGGVAVAVTFAVGSLIGSGHVA